jgi:hypothetical protein
MMVYARALFLINTAEERVEALDIISDRFEFCDQRTDIAKFRSRSHDAAFSEKTGSTPGRFKNIWRFRRSPCQLLRLPKRIGLKSYLRLSALVVQSSSITSSDASTHFRLARNTGWRA